MERGFITLATSLGEFLLHKCFSYCSVPSLELFPSSPSAPCSCFLEALRWHLPRSQGFVLPDTGRLRGSDSRVKLLLVTNEQYYPAWLMETESKAHSLPLKLRSHDTISFGAFLCSIPSFLHIWHSKACHDFTGLRWGRGLLSYWNKLLSKSYYQ